MARWHKELSIVANTRGLYLSLIPQLNLEKWSRNLVVQCQIRTNRVLLNMMTLPRLSMQFVKARKSILKGVEINAMANDYDEEYIQALEKQVEILAHHLQIVCLDVEALPSHQEIYGNGAYEMINRLEALWETKISADKVIGEHFEIMNGFKGD